MPRAFSLHLCGRVLADARDDRLSHRTIAARFRVGESTARARLRRLRTACALAAKPHVGGSRPKVDAAGRRVLTALVDEQPGRTLAELAAKTLLRCAMPRRWPRSADWTSISPREYVDPCH